ncbi:MAG: MFS transporter, partial [Mycobacterium sp.]
MINRRIRSPGNAGHPNQVMLTSGILVAYIANWALKGLPDTWRWMLGVAAGPGLVLAVGMLFVPPSPRWL